MTGLREAAQMALDALEQVQEADTAGATPKMVMEARKLYEPTITALRAALAQPEQEPMAKMREMLEVQGRDGNWNYDAYMHGMYNGMEFMMALAERRDPVFRKPPEKWLHDAPQREWQGLTDEEIRKLSDDCAGVRDENEFIRAIEAKLKEKNT